MRLLGGNTIRTVSFVVLTVLLVLVALVAFITYRVDGEHSGFLASAAQYHTGIMAGLVAVSLVFGFVTSQMLYAQVRRKEQGSRSILAVVLLFLSTDEREIVNYLVQKNGSTTQAEIARLPHLNRVRAHRSLAKMQEKQILDVIAHGKVRRVVLKQHILELLV